MKKYILIYLSILFTFLISDKMPNDVRWVVNSNEYNVLCKQVYKMAANQLDHFLKRYKGNKPLAIVMDLDETVLDNSKYQIELYRNKETFNMNSWSKWVQREEAELVPILNTPPEAKRY